MCLSGVAAAPAVVMARVSLKTGQIKMCRRDSAPSVRGPDEQRFALPVCLQNYSINPHPCGILCFLSLPKPLRAFCRGHSKGITNNTAGNKRLVMDTMGRGVVMSLQFYLACRYSANGGQVT